MRPLLLYTAARLVTLAASGGVLYLLGARGLLLVVLAFAVSALVSYVLLARQRDALAVRLGDRVERTRQRFEERTRAEDEMDERTRSQSEGRDTTL